MTEEEELQAARMRRVAERAELRAGERRALAGWGGIVAAAVRQAAAAAAATAATAAAADKAPVVRFITKEEREAMHAAKEREAAAAMPTEAPPKRPKVEAAPAPKKPTPATSTTTTAPSAPPPTRPPPPTKTAGGGKQRFKFDWSADDDTSALAYGLGGPEEEENGHAVSSHAAQSKDRFLSMLDRRVAPSDSATAATTTTNSKHQPTNKEETWRTKPLPAMTERDWRIMREDLDIRIRGGQAPHPARSWGEMEVPEHVKLSLIHI